MLRAPRANCWLGHRLAASTFLRRPLFSCSTSAARVGALSATLPLLQRRRSGRDPDDDYADACVLTEEAPQDRVAPAPSSSGELPEASDVSAFFSGRGSSDSRRDAYADDLLGFDDAHEGVPLSASSSSAVTDDSDRIWLDTVMTLLPPDGRAMPLTTVTPGLPVEAITATHGSVAAFLRCHSPTKIKLTEEVEVSEPGSSRRGPRLYVALARARASPTAAVATLHAAPPTPDTPAPKRRRVVLQRVSSPALSPAAPDASAADRVKLDSLVACVRALLVSNASMHIGSARNMLPAEQKTHLADLRFGSLLAFLRSVPEEFDVSGDGREVARKGTMSLAALRPPVFFPRLKPFEQHVDEEWNVDLDVDDEGDDGGSGGFQSAAESALPAPFGLGGPGVVAPRHDALTSGQFSPLPADSQPVATYMPPPTAATVSAPVATSPLKPPPLATIGGTATPRSAGSPQTLPGSWRTPTEMLGLFVACIPAGFAVPIQLVISTAELKQALGRSSLQKALKTYAYFFDFSCGSGTSSSPSTAGTATHVRLKASVVHPRKGSADELYSTMRRSTGANGDVIVPSPSPFPTLAPAVAVAREKSSAAATVRAAGSAGFRWGETAGASRAATTQPSASSSPSPRATLVAPIAYSPVVRMLLAEVPCDATDIATMPLSESLLSHPDIQGSRAAIRSVLAAHGELFLLSDDGGAEVRLRPINVAPNALADFDTRSSLLPHELVVHIVDGIKTAGVWMSCELLSSKLPEEVRTALLSTGFSFPVFLRHHGRSLYVSADNTKVRRFVMHPDIDECSHFVAKELRSALSTVVTASTSDLPLPEAIKALSATWQPLLSPDRVFPEDPAEGARIVVRFLRNYPTLFVLSGPGLAAVGNDVAAAGSSLKLEDILIGRASAFRRAAAQAVPTATIAPTQVIPATPTAGLMTKGARKEAAGSGTTWSPVVNATSSWASFTKR